MTLLHMESDYGDSMPRHRYSDPDFFDLAGASYEQQSKLGSLQGMQVMLRDIWVNNINEARKVHPELGDEPVFLRGTIGAYLKEQLDEEPNFWHTVPEFAQDLTEFFGLEPIEKDEHGYTEMFAENLAAMRAYDERLRELKEIDPSVMTFTEAWEETQKQAREIQERTSTVLERGPSFSAGGLAGGIVGSFTHRDPQNLFTLGIGGELPVAAFQGIRLALGAEKVARGGMAARVISEGGVQAGIELLSQYGGVRESRRLLGLPEISVLESVAMAAAGGAGFRGLFEGVGAGFRSLSKIDRARAELDPADARAKLASEAEARAQPAPQAAGSLNGRTAQIIIERRKQALLNSTMPVTREGRRYDDAVETQIENIFENRPVQPLPEGPLTDSTQRLARVPEGHPFREIAKERNPEASKNLDEANAKVEKLEQEIEGLKETTDLEVISRLDEASGQRLEAIDAELGKPISRARRAQLYSERSSLIDGFDYAEIKKAHDQLAIPRKKKTATKVKALRVARKEQRDAHNAVEDAVDNVSTVEPVRTWPRLMPRAAQEKDTSTARVSYDSAEAPARQAEAEAAAARDVEPEVIAARTAAAAGEDIAVGKDAALPPDYQLADGTTVRQKIEELDDEAEFSRQVEDCAR